ncbi:MAG TPA: hypothetical protein VJ743_07470, partial [Albitalea sp.]|nr:hypothetical protein [Albitalea sp.]
MTAGPLRALVGLDATIANAGDPIELACLRAERATLMARMGSFERATAELEAVRREHERMQSSPALAAWLCLAEGITAMYRDQGLAARDRVRRAHALSTAARVRPLTALTAAWMAHMAYIYNDYAGIARHLVEALTEAPPDHHAARSRASLTAAQSYHWAGRIDFAQPWYRRAHEHALAEGDTTTIAHLLSSRAWLSGMHACTRPIFDGEPACPDALSQALMAADSSGHFDDHLGRASLRSMARITRARLLLAQGHWADALAQFESGLPLAMSDGMDYVKLMLHAEMAWCRFKLGRSEEALQEARRAEASLIPDCEGEDRASTHGRLAQ